MGLLVIEIIFEYDVIPVLALVPRMLHDLQFIIHYYSCRVYVMLRTESETIV